MNFINSDEDKIKRLKKKSYSSFAPISRSFTIPTATVLGFS